MRYPRTSPRALLTLYVAYNGFGVTPARRESLRISGSLAKPVGIVGVFVRVGCRKFELRHPHMSPRVPRALLNVTKVVLSLPEGYCNPRASGVAGVNAWT